MMQKLKLLLHTRQVMKAILQVALVGKAGSETIAQVIHCVSCQETEPMQQDQHAGKLPCLHTATQRLSGKEVVAAKTDKL